MAIALTVTAVIMLFTVKGIELLPSGDLMGVFDIWYKFVLGCLAYIILGMFMSFGVGLYAPSMAVISLLGIDFLVVFPIMMCSAGFTMHINAYRYYRDNNYLPKTSFCMTLGGICGVIASFTIMFVGVGNIPGVDMNFIKEIFKWFSIPAISYAAYLLYKSYFKSRKNKKVGTSKLIKIDYTKFLQFVEQQLYSTMLVNYKDNRSELKNQIENKNIKIQKWV